MPVYVDDMEAPFRGMIMCHMLADTHEELMAMAALLRLDPAWLQHPGTPKEHFDISLGKKRLALARGALPITWDEAGAHVARKRLAAASGPYVAAPLGTTPAPGATMHPHVIVCTRRGGGARKCTSCQAFRHDIRLCDYPLNEEPMPKEPLQDIAGKPFGRLIALQIVGRQHRHAIWECLCACGEITEVSRPNLISGSTESCGCLEQESRLTTNITHGATIGRTKSSEYGIWSSMIKRCENPKAKGWERYGGRGITVCERWRHDFAAFLADMGTRPSTQHSIDRYPISNGNYEPANCRWATPLEQNRNRSNLIKYTVDGRTGVLSELAEVFGKKAKTVRDRVRAGWSLELALMTPVKQAGQTCSRVVCTRCAVHVEPDLDYCAAHGRALAAQGKESDAPSEPQRPRTPGESADPPSHRVRHRV
jgi:Protein of unknown function (DUF4031)